MIARETLDRIDTLLTTADLKRPCSCLGSAHASSCREQQLRLIAWDRLASASHDALPDLIAAAREAADLQAALDSIIVRCEEGDPSVDWRPTIASIARAALAAARGQAATGETT